MFDTQDRWSAVLAALAVLAFAACALIALTGGIATSIGPLSVSARDPYRPYYLGLVLGCLALWRSDRGRAVPTWNLQPRFAPWLVAGAAALTVYAGIRYGAFVAGASDGYGYVSEALLWSSGRLTVPEPLAHVTPPIGASIAPLGYRVAANSSDIVPIYPAGLPLLMAVAIKIGGLTAAFLVVPFLGAVGVWLTYHIGTQVGGMRTGLMAALLLACSPIFLLQAMQPMSDVPATTFWLAALAIAMSGPTIRNAFLSGLVISGALLIRPNLIPLAAVVGLLVLTSGPRMRRGAAFTLGVVPGAILVALINGTLYGSPLISGYGPNAALFSVGWIGANLQRYPLWLLQLQTPFVLLSVIGVGVGSDTTPTPRRLTGLLLLFSAVVLACYLVYTPFESWAFLRFLLPAIPLLLILSSLSALWFISTAPVRLRSAIFAGVCGVMCGQYIQRAEAVNIFHDGASQRRYTAVAGYVDRTLPQNAVVITVLHSGSLRLYGHRQTVRWDLIEPDNFDETIRTLQGNGYAAYILVEGSEEPTFQARFGQTEFGALDWLPMADYDNYERVRLYSADDRARSRRGAVIETARIQP